MPSRSRTRHPSPTAAPFRPLRCRAPVQGPGPESRRLSLSWRACCLRRHCWPRRACSGLASGPAALGNSARQPRRLPPYRPHWPGKSCRTWPATTAMSRRPAKRPGILPPGCRSPFLPHTPTTPACGQCVPSPAISNGTVTVAPRTAAPRRRVPAHCRAAGRGPGNAATRRVMAGALARRLVPAVVVVPLVPDGFRPVPLDRPQCRARGQPGLERLPEGRPAAAARQLRRGN